MAKLQIEGLDGLTEILEKMADIKKLEAAMKKACALVEGEAKKNAPKGTGELRRSIESKVEVQGKEVTGTIFTPLEYAPYVEFGTGLFAEGGNGRKDVPWNYQDDEGEWHSTSGMQPQPFMRPALTDNREKVIRIIEEGILND